MKNLIEKALKFRKPTKEQRYNELVLTYSDDVYRYAFWLAKNKHDAEDVVQETFIRAWRYLDNLKDNESAKSWLLTIARNENNRRFAGKRNEYEHIDVEDQVLSVDGGFDNDKEFLQQQIANLPDHYREPLVLQTLYGFGVEEIAEQLGLNRNTVSTRLARAKQILIKGSEFNEQKQVGQK